MVSVFKKLLSLCLVVCASTTLTLLVLRSASTSAGGASQPSGMAGDANGDAVVDLSDPIYLLQYLFNGGPAPVACARSAAQDVLLWARGSSGSANGTLYRLFDEGSEQLLVGDTAMPIPRDGVLHGLRVAESPSSQADFEVTVIVNGIATALAASTASVPPVDPGVSVPVAAGDTVSFRFTGPVGTTGAGMACCLLGD